MKQPKAGDVVIWDLDPEKTVKTYMLKVEGSGSPPKHIEGSNVWSKVYDEVKRLAGPGRTIWKRDDDGSVHPIDPS